MGSDAFYDFLEDQMELSKLLSERGGKISSKDVELFKKAREKSVVEEQAEVEIPVEVPVEVPAPVKKRGRKEKERPQSPIKPDPGVHPGPKA